MESFILCFTLCGLMTFCIFALGVAIGRKMKDDSDTERKPIRNNSRNNIDSMRDKLNNSNILGHN